MERTFSFGYWVQRRRKALNLTQAALARQVGCATITIKKLEHDERRPSRLMAARLADCLMVAPAERASFLAGALGEASVEALPVAQAPLPAAPDPELRLDPETETRFVGRDRELAWLDAQLDLALAGEGRVVFIGGEAGRGKTTLAAAFARGAARRQPALLLASGTCNAYAGTGDPYLPFREVLSGLTAESEARWLPAAASAENTRRLWQALPATFALLAEHGPQLIGVLVPAKGLLARAQAAAPGGAAWLAALQTEVARRETGVAAPDQSALFTQVTRVLGGLARARPLLISLDDLHWADEASLGLLFHLARRLAGTRLLILATYRPEEMAAVPAGRPHPLEGVLAEIRRTYGDNTLDLDAADLQHGRAFVNAYLDAEPNQLDESFRQGLFHQTGGHALFTVELLRELQARQVLVRDASGQWHSGEALDWSTMPVRVEAVIARRLDRLEPALRDLLAVASVEGELFTAEVVAEVLGVEPGLLLRSLGQQLARRHRLVRASGELDAGGHSLSVYQFEHALFQQFLYQQLDPGERRRLHAAVANTLAALYAGQADEIAVQLARHFEAARLPRQAITYLRLAGEKAMRLSAVFEAISLLGQALALLASLPDTPAEAQQKLRLQLLLGEAQFRAGRLAEAMTTYLAATALAEQVGAAEAQARAALGYEEARWRFNLPTAPSVRLLQAALTALGQAEPVLQARLQVGLAQALMPVCTAEVFFELSAAALAAARRTGDPRALFEALYLTVRGDRRPEQSAARLATLEELLALLPETGLGREAGVEIYGFRMLEHLELGDRAACLVDQTHWAPASLELQQPLYDYATTLAMTMWALLGGDLAEAERLARLALRLGQRMQVEHVDGTFGMQMFTIRREQGRLAELAPLVRRFVAEHAEHAVWRPGLALIYSELGLRAEAQQEFERLAAGNFAAVARDDLWATCMLYLSEVCAYLGDAARAAPLYEHLQPYAGRNLILGYMSAFLGPADYYLGLLSAARQRWTEAEQHFLEAMSMNTGMEAWPALAHTQLEYARLLRARGRSADQAYARRLMEQALDTADRLGLAAVRQRALGQPL